MSGLILKNRNYVDRWRSFLLDILFPIECLGCSLEGAWLCNDCFRKIEITSNLKCQKCKVETDWGEYCDGCRQSFFLNGVWSATDYNDRLVKDLIKSYKYRFVSELSPILAKVLRIQWTNLKNKLFLSSNNAPAVLSDIRNTILIPAPLHKKREKWRGFNQSLELAKHFAEAYNLTTNFENLIRTKNTSAQAKKSGAKRRISLTDSFLWTGSPINNQNIILLDDVVTTGSTLNECAKTLKMAGAGEVWGMVLAGD